MQAAGLTETLGDAEGSYTVLAPSDAAFGLFPQADLDALAANVDALNVVRTPSVLRSQFSLVQSVIPAQPFSFLYGRKT